MGYDWSKRTAWDLTETAWARELARLRAAGIKLYDLTASNPTACGLHYDETMLLAPLQNPQSLHYHPDPKGLRQAREAVSRYYADHGARVDPEQIILTISTSEAYSFLFRLLCDPGDEVLIGRPGYPLFDFLAQLDDVVLKPYDLFYDHGWHLDAAALHRQITPHSRAIVVVHPNNPTGHFAPRAELEAICRQHGLALVVDEVFLDYGHGSRQGESFATGSHPVPTFVLSGLSKVAGLPQMKAAWLACFAQTEALNRLEVISDTFLSMNSPIQGAIPAWLDGRATLQRQIRGRVERNLEALDQALSEQTLISRLETQAGWYAVLRVPGLRSDEETALALLKEEWVVIHPGSFFGFAGQGWLVISLLADEKEFLSGVAKVVKQFNGQSG
jgi:aspartate/methionine/tyrosine aminotransferase